MVRDALGIHFPCHRPARPGDPVTTAFAFLLSRWLLDARLRGHDNGKFNEHDAYMKAMTPAAHPGRLLKRELSARGLSANRLSLDLGVPSGRITDILNGRRSITADTALRLGRYFGTSAQFWLDLQSQYDIALLVRERGQEIARRVRPADAA
jgi:antitoxin HigA-1